MAVTELADLTDPDRCPRLVVKIGSALLVDPDGAARRDWLATLVGELADLRRAGQGLLVVSSGAIALGAGRLGLPPRPRRTLAQAQAAAAIGQIELARSWADLFAARGVTAAQMLLTLGDLEDRRRTLNASATLGALGEAGVIAVVNENDSVATEEIRFGDNDRLAARVAQAVGADGVLLLSDVDGLYRGEEDDPVRTVEAVTPEVRGWVRGAGSLLGTGGMASKLDAAEIAQRSGIALGLIGGRHDAPIGRAMRSGRGTLFPARTGATSARKSWLAARQVRGALVVDEGCAEALRGGASVLAPGIVTVEGVFERGDAVAVRDAAGRSLARGLSEYDSATLARLAGQPRERQAELLGHEPRAAAIHRNSMVML